MSDEGWDQFLDEHATVIGYDLEGAFLPIRPGCERSQRIMEAFTTHKGRDMPKPVLGWRK